MSEQSKELGKGKSSGGVMGFISRWRESRPKLTYAKIYPDPLFLTLALVLTVIGAVMMFSASSAYAERQYGDSFHFLSNHIKHLLIGALFCMIIHMFTPNWFRLGAVGGYAAAIVMLVFVLFMGISGGGAQRWIPLGPIQLQPSEIAKTGLVMMMALYAAIFNDKLTGKCKKGEGLLYGLVFPALMIGVIVILMVFEKHLSGILIIGCLGVTMMFMGGTKLRYFLLCLLIVACLVPIAWYVITNVDKFSYILDRIESFTNRGADALGSDWQVTQGLYAIGTGGLFGLGLGQSRLKYGYVSQPQNDFVFPVVCEELGFIGVAFILLLFLALIGRGFVLASRAPDRFCALTMYGLSFKIALHTILNIGVVTAWIPNTGISLPFFSSGGTATIMQMVDIGIILGMSRFCMQKK